ncbi:MULTISPECIES: YqaA family protein [Thalassobaculum]|uniref:Membrane protein YqaA, SNARE-associated domain n=1 Tax=Thalassobaculum litoreum DSM 18839 TaxID=1123362 RepID=A0A8G2BFZ3_9PROT|nr:MULTISPECIES: YqaA family protein [Thalassobaculum]SDF08768.1 membrane protein YqaA, SNARE-associated domain [Thalassobaculum litoreum DSM 18839]
MSFIGAYGGLFLISLGAATFLPIQSEFLLTGLLLKTDYSVVALVLVASLGNTLGSVINWVIGLQIEKFKDKKWFPATPEQLDRASRWYQRYGYWSLLLSWAPFIGDPLTLAAGLMREPLWVFVILVAIAKTLRYVIVTALILGVF